MPLNRRTFLKSSTITLASTGSLAQVILATLPASARGPRPFTGYGALVPDPNGLLDLPAGFTYRVFSREGDAMGAGIVPGSHDGMAAFGLGAADALVRNHEIEPEDVEEDGVVPVPKVPGKTYDEEAVGGTTTVLVGRNRRLLDHHVSLAGTSNNCAGGPTPWDTWLTCEETDSVLGKPHGYVFEVDPLHGGNPDPIRAMGRFEHEAVAIDRHGRAYLTEDAGGPHGCFYRFSPRRPLGGCGSLHAGGALAAMAVAGLGDTDLSIVQEPGLVLPVSWIPVPNVDPGEDDATVREQVIAAGATPIQKAEGVWTGLDGSIWFVSSRGDGPDAEDEEDRSAAVHAGQIWKYNPRTRSIELVVIFPAGSPYDGPDNITAGPHGFALACTDGEDDQWLVGIDDAGGTFEFAKNPAGDDEFAGATFSPDGDTLYVNIQGQPALTFAIRGPWRRR
jgi:secreted PhoX family phosphatase